MVKGKTRIETTESGFLELDRADIIELIRSKKVIPSGIKDEDLRIFVRVPGGGDWSNTDLHIKGDQMIDGCYIQVSWSKTTSVIKD